jgi:hypothetical protein
MPQIDANEKLLTDVIKRLDRKISRLISTLAVGNTGRLTSDAINLKKAIQMRKDIAKEFGKYNAAARIASDYSPVGKELSKIFKDAGISGAITRQDKSILKILSGDSYNQMSSLGNQYEVQISNKIYSGVLVGDSVEDMTQEISQLLVGGTDKAGRPMANHAKTIATTGYREADSIILEKKGEEFGIEKWEYAGSLIKDSRKWCMDHVGKTYTIEEIKEWNDRSWKGKKEGNPFVTRGGWNCRHRWLPVVDED